MFMTRRAALFGTVSTLALAACSGDGLTPAQVVADAQGVAGAFAKALPIITAADPDLIPPATDAKVTGEINLAQGTLSALAANLPPASTGQSVLGKVVGYFNDALDAASAVTPAAAALFPELAPAVPLIQAASVLIPMIEAFVTPVPAGTTTQASLRAKALAPSMTVDEARTRLGVKAVG
jgi:hypothetical protein